MGRGNDPGKDFDNQYNRNRARGQDRASRGESYWADDKKIEGLGSPGGPSGAGGGGGCALIGTLLVGLGVLANEAIRYAA